jgi:type IV pilus assembly protein PilA
MKNVKNVKKNNKGFSLVELIVVIAIMAVLVGVLAPTFIKYVESSRQSTDIQNVQQIKTAIETQLADKEGTIGTTSIAISGTTITVTLDGSVVTTLDAVANIPSLKSNGWPTATFTYTPASGSWTATNASGAITKAENTNAPKKDMISVFSY